MILLHLQKLCFTFRNKINVLFFHLISIYVAHRCLFGKRNIKPVSTPLSITYVADDCLKQPNAPKCFFFQTTSVRIKKQICVYVIYKTYQSLRQMLFSYATKKILDKKKYAIFDHRKHEKKLSLSTFFLICAL